MPRSESHGLRYVLVWLGLLLLTAASYLASQVSLGGLGTVIGLAIATAKVTLVGLFFMHLLEEPFTVVAVGLITLIWVAMLCAGVFADVAFR